MQLQGKELLLKRRDQALQSAKMVLKFRDNTIATLERGRTVRGFRPAAALWDLAAHFPAAPARRARPPSPSASRG